MNSFVRKTFHRENLKPGIPLLLFLIVTAIVVKYQFFGPTRFLLRDPLATATEFFVTLKNSAGSEPTPNCCHPLLGMISNVGCVLWFSAAASAFLGAALMRPEQAREKSFLLLAGFFSAVLGADDLFMLHEALFPSLGFGELAVHGLYAVIGAVYLLLAFRLRHHFRMPFLMTALLFLSASVFIDLAMTGKQYEEDMFKFAGISYWAAFHFLLVTDLASGVDFNTSLAGPGRSSM